MLKNIALKAGYILPVLVFLGLLAFTGFSQTKSPQFDSLSADQLKSAVVHFTRTQCYGTCPAYKLAINGDGRIEYEGVENVKVKDQRTGKIAESDLRAIMAAFSKAKFYSIGKDVSESNCTCNLCTDFPNVITEISIGGVSHRVDHYHGCACASKELFNLETEIDRIAKTEQWTGDVSKAGPFGTTCFPPKPGTPRQ